MLGFINLSVRVYVPKTVTIVGLRIVFTVSVDLLCCLKWAFLKCQNGLLNH